MASTGNFLKKRMIREVEDLARKRSIKALGRWYIFDAKSFLKNETKQERALQKQKEAEIAAINAVFILLNDKVFSLRSMPQSKRSQQRQISFKLFLYVLSQIFASPMSHLQTLRTLAKIRKKRCERITILYNGKSLFPGRRPVKCLCVS